MKVEKLIEIIGKGEGLEVEFKECRQKLSTDVFDTVCAFLNTQGGHLFWGVNDQGEITGIAAGIIDNIDRYDDRDYVETNLIESYQRLMAFCQKHLPDRFYLENDQRISIRDRIFREVIVNLLIHREYLDHYPAKLEIEQGQVITENSNLPHFMGEIDPDDFSPYPKNPNICRLFKEIGLADELGSGVRNLYKYVKYYSNGGSPQLIEQNIFKVIIPVMESKAIKDTGQDSDQVSDQEKKIILLINEGEVSLKEIMQSVGYKHATYFRNKFIYSLQKKRYIELTNKDNPKSRNQKYRLTMKGEKLLNKLRIKDKCAEHIYEEVKS